MTLCACPRVDYGRTYVLLPQMDALEAADWRQGAAIGGAVTLDTFGHSADDAGVGPLNRVVVAVNPESWGREPTIDEFLHRHYPGADFEPLYAETPQELGVKLLPPLPDGADIAQGQSWLDWRDERFGEDAATTIGKYGCFLTGLCIILRKTYGRDVTPPLLDRLLVAARVAYWNDNLLDWDAACGLFGAFGEVRKDNAAYTGGDLHTLLHDGWEVILRRADGAHFVYLESVTQYGALRIIDTWDGQRKDAVSGQYRGVRAVKVEV